FSEGTVSGFGSVYVNGIRFATDRADIVVDGTPAAEDALRVGMVLNVAGDVASDGLSGSARRVEFDRPLYGPVDAYDATARRLVILGQPVQLDDATVFSGVTEDTLQEGLLCMVSGYPSPGELLATLLECRDDYAAGLTRVEVEGVVSGLDTGAGRFHLGALEVAVGAATIDTAQGALADGALVEVLGTQAQRGDVLQAERIRIKGASLKTGQAVLLEGVIGRFASLQDFELNRRRVSAGTAQREDRHALAPASGVRMRLAGSVRADGVIEATRYALQPPTDILLTGRVDEVDAARERLRLFGAERQALVVTQYEDRRATGERAFRLEDLQPGDYVQLRGFRDAQGQAVVTRIERRDEEPPEGGTIVVRLRIQIGTVDPAAARTRGPLDGFSLVDNRLVIAGVAVQTDNARTEFFDRNGASVTGVQFYNGLRAGDRLEAVGNEASDVIQATRVRYVR
ncbi:MAG TPA: DUF5666 domain-containing protein, partial [Nevskiales bacterium]|nr:DUF5666 domain-containing protein [Nevskiales bacterium]